MAGSGDRALNATDWHTASGGVFVVILFALSLAAQPSAISPNPEFTRALRAVKADRILKRTVAEGNPLLEITDAKRLCNKKIDEQCGRFGVLDRVSDLRPNNKAKIAARQQRIVMGFERIQKAGLPQVTSLKSPDVVRLFYRHLRQYSRDALA